MNSLVLTNALLIALVFLVLVGGAGFWRSR